MNTSRRSLAASSLLMAVVAAMITALLGACVGGHEESPLPTSVGVADLLGTPSRFDGQVVTVTGVAIIQFEGTTLHPSLALAKETIESGVWLDLDDYRRYAGFDRKNVKVRGKFLSGPGGHLNLAPGEISPVLEISILDEDHGGAGE